MANVTVDKSRVNTGQQRKLIHIYTKAHPYIYISQKSTFIPTYILPSTQPHIHTFTHGSTHPYIHTSPYPSHPHILTSIHSHIVTSSHPHPHIHTSTSSHPHHRIHSFTFIHTSTFTHQPRIHMHTSHIQTYIISTPTHQPRIHMHSNINTSHIQTYITSMSTFTLSNIPTPTQKFIS